MICLVPNCGHIPRCRGLCEKHYAYAAKIVRDGKKTWNQLVSQGKATEIVKRGRKGADLDWFME